MISTGRMASTVADAFWSFDAAGGAVFVDGFDCIASGLWFASGAAEFESLWLDDVGRRAMLICGGGSSFSFCLSKILGLSWPIVRWSFSFFSSFFVRIIGRLGSYKKKQQLHQTALIKRSLFSGRSLILMILRSSSPFYQSWTKDLHRIYLIPAVFFIPLIVGHS